VTELEAPHEARRYANGFQALQRELLAARRRNIQPPPKLTLSEWAAKYAVLSRETSAQTRRAGSVLSRIRTGSWTPSQIRL